MNIFKIYLPLFLFIFISKNFYGQDICTNYTATPGTTISSSGANLVYDTVINVPDSYTISDVNVTVDISHSWNDDLEIYIISPSGNNIKLSTDNGGNRDDYNNVTFDDASSNSLPNGNSNLSGDYRPEEPLAGFNNENSNGNWILRVIDDANNDGGTIHSITLNLCYASAPTPVGGHLGPGGVGSSDGSSDLVLWLDANTITQANATQVTSWTDNSGVNNNASAPSGTGPNFNLSQINGYPNLEFDISNTEYLRVANDNSLRPEKISIFVVGNLTNSSNSWGAFLSKTTTGSWDDGYGLTRDGGNQAIRGFINHWNTNYTTTNINYNINSIMTLNYDKSNVELYKNESSPTTDNYTNNISNSNDYLYLGYASGSYYLDGDIAEVIILKTDVNDAERIIINNYLSAKYNIALSSNDIYTQDNPGRGDFDHNVAGIGQASDGSNHTDSQGTGIVRINNPRNLQDDKFLFWGEETKNPTYNFSTNTNNYTEQLNSKWRVKRKGSIGNVDVSFDISGMDLSGKQGCVDLQLVVGNDYTFSTIEDVYNLTIVGSTATATNVRLRQNRYFTLRYADQIVWNGTSFYNGDGTSNAPDNTNSCLKLTVKSGTAATLTFDAHVRKIEIEPGGTLNVADGILLQADNQVVIDGSMDLLGEAQLIQNHPGTTVNSGSGSLKIRQQGTTNPYNYNYWSAPVNRSGSWQIGYLEDANGAVNFTSGINANPLTTPITLSSRWLYGFQGPSNDYNAWSPFSTTTNISPGIGYTMKGSGAASSNQEFIFQGIPNDGNYDYSVTANTEILIGNPYPSALDADQFITDNLSVIDGSLYFWESFSTNNSHYLADYEGGYATYSLMLSVPAVADASGLTSGNGATSKPAPTQYVGVGQGFFTIINNTGSIVFNNDQRDFARESANETVYYKTDNTKNKRANLEDERPKLWFSFTDPKGSQKTIGLGYDTSASYEYDNGYDAKPIDYFNNDLFWLLNNEKLIIQALPELNIEDSLPLGIQITDAGLYKFSISNMENIPDDMDIYLVDKNQNTYYNLRENDAQLILNSGTENNQFSIVFQEDNILGTTSFDDNHIFVSYNSDMKILELHTKEPLTSIQNLQIYNILGQNVLNIKLPNSNRIDVSLLDDGTYILKVASKTNNNQNSIKFVKY
jgi:subtilisin-like proprotein convertase family protein